MKLCRILCVEDNASLQFTLKTGLERYGFEVIVASNGIEALTQFQTHLGEFSAILTDNEMPHMNGLEFIRSVREIGYKGRIVVMSGNFKPKDLLAYQSHAISGFFHKPFDIGLLATMLLQTDSVGIAPTES